jgi:hypothetical protein
MLYLDISKAFNNISYKRLIYNLKMKAFLPSIIKFI